MRSFKQHIGLQGPILFLGPMVKVTVLLLLDKLYPQQTRCVPFPANGISQSFVVSESGVFPLTLLVVIKKEVKMFSLLRKRRCLTQRSMGSSVHQDFFLASKKLEQNLNYSPPTIQVLLSKPFNYAEMVSKEPLLFSFHFFLCIQTYLLGMMFLLNHLLLNHLITLFHRKSFFRIYLIVSWFHLPILFFWSFSARENQCEDLVTGTW